MASEREAEKEVRAHLSTYEGFTTLFKWGTILALITAAIVVLAISG